MSKLFPNILCRYRIYLLHSLDRIHIHVNLAYIYIYLSLSLSQVLGQMLRDFLRRSETWFILTTLSAAITVLNYALVCIIRFNCEGNAECITVMCSLGSECDHFGGCRYLATCVECEIIRLTFTAHAHNCQKKDHRYTHLNSDLASNILDPRQTTRMTILGSL